MFLNLAEFSQRAVKFSNFNQTYGVIKIGKIIDSKSQKTVKLKFFHSY